jgi:predicted RNA-binding Zn ribbon-like protein
VRAIADCARLERHPTSDHIATVNEFLAAVPFRFELTPGGDALHTSTDPPSPVAGAAAEIALSVARYLTGEEYKRLKMCDNAGCRWMFHDDTKNRSRRWCRVCGNVDKVRRFRERQRAREHADHAPPAAIPSAEACVSETARRGGRPGPC